MLSLVPNYMRIEDWGSNDLNLCSFNGDSPSRSLISNCNPTELWIPNILICNGQIKLNKEFLKALCDVVFAIFLVGLFLLFITLGKNNS